MHYQADNYNHYKEQPAAAVVVRKVAIPGPGRLTYKVGDNKGQLAAAVVVRKVAIPRPGR